jgi:hypothetical protein
MRMVLIGLEVAGNVAELINSDWVEKQNNDLEESFLLHRESSIDGEMPDIYSLSFESTNQKRGGKSTQQQIALGVAESG